MSAAISACSTGAALAPSPADSLGAADSPKGPDSSAVTAACPAGVARAPSPGDSVRAPECPNGADSSAVTGDSPPWADWAPVVVDSAAGSLDDAEGGGEIRGLWVVRHTLATPEGVRAAVAAAEENNFNALFVQIRGRGETYYRSDIEPRARELSRADSADFDPLELLLALAHESGIQVHAWLNVYFTWSEEELPESPKHVINRHPEWISADANGTRLNELSTSELRGSWIEGVYLSPGIPEVRGYLSDVASEIVIRYPVDGVHLDYVRYPGRRTGLDEHSRAQFRKEHLFDPLEFFSTSQGSDLFCGPLAIADMGALWENWRTAQVTELVSLLSRELRSLAPNLVLSAAVRPDPDRAVRDYGQDWVRWLEEGYVDLVAPMVYTESTRKFFKSLGKMKRSVPDSLERCILAGISLYNQKPRLAAEKIEVARAADIGGFVLFSYDSAVNRKDLGYLPYLKSRVLGGDALDKTALGR